MEIKEKKEGKKRKGMNYCYTKLWINLKVVMLSERNSCKGIHTVFIYSVYE